MSTQKRVLVPASPENILRTHVGVILITLCTVAALLGTLGVMYGYVKFRRAKRSKLEKKLEHEGMNDSIIHLARIKTDEKTASRRSKSWEKIFPRRPTSFGNDYGMIGFENCGTSYMESIIRGVLPGDVVLPENGASTARNIRNTSAVLTPPMTPDKCKIPVIQHWNQIVPEYPRLPGPLAIGNTSLLEVPIPPPLAISKEGKELPSSPITRGRRMQRWEEVDRPLFGAVKRASMRRRARSKNGVWDTPRSKSQLGIGSSSLRRFRELEARRSARARKEKYRKRRIYG
ncbi:uncharacterized protein DFL_003165 [Arthrobotrys flagrans]|uniref:Uncharacterized protein n=1 Tax=Arthrobotrys flagrans TaxID=97331 RepID=A0A437A1A8_ARTFL|nr:hypothetical protein DFL_003165 [Arthrobotrys flagrans]